ncbi:Phosphatidylinositol transfer protein SFH5 [Cytospora mali]|uniref:Phosphatidylinositol transfer protein SFH5 n=1 Tax=Cytospora mali TaxID=578113 RepID=A0A194VJB0_CYTMA|nr:Phosphatidylinositol transfer protein SFH5 [Valsa mali]
MADTSNTEVPKVDATPAAEEIKADAPAETAQAEKTEKTEGELPAEATTDPAPAPANATEENVHSATAESVEETPTDEASTVAPSVTGTKTKEAKPTEEMKDELKAEENTESTTKEVAPKKTPFDEFEIKLPEILKEIDHDEMWGVKLVTPVSTSIPTQIVLQKFLNANDGDPTKAVDQFKGALKFRKEKKPVELVKKTFSANKFADLGAVTVYPVKDSTVPEVFTWNLYGNVKGKMEEVFVPLNDELGLTDLDRFMDYRIALQELGIQQLKLSDATEPITAEKDPYKIMQVHDYKSISFLRQPPSVKAASTEVIKQFALAYPELLKEKFFVNVPAIMGWMYALIKVFIAEKTAKKFHPMANGANLAAEFKESHLDAKQLPKEYGGEGGSGDGKMKDIPGLVSILKFE